MRQRIFSLIAMLAMTSILFIAVPGSGEAQMQCADCHVLHNAPGGTLNKATEFDLICDSCHGPAGTAKYADRHVDPAARYQNDPGGTVAPAWEIGCVVCHTPHPTDTVNQLYNNGTQHAHNLGGDGGNLVDGVNIKLVGRDEDGTGVAKLAMPIRIVSVGTSASCPNSNTDVQVEIQPFSVGEGPLQTIMVGDRISITNANAEFNGTYRVKETDWDNFQATAGSGWVCFDRPNPASYSGSGFIQSRGWNPRPVVKNAVWAANTATLTLNNGYSIRVGDNINVSGVPEVNANTFNGLKTVTAVTSTHVSTAAWSAGTATLTLIENHLYQVGDSIVVTDVISGGPASFNGKFTLTAVAGADVSYALAADPGAYSNNGTVHRQLGMSQVAYATTDPGTTNVASGQLEYLGSMKSIQSMVVVQPPGPSPYLVTNATWTAGKGGKPGPAVLTLDRTHPFVIDDVITVSGVVSGGPGSFNGTWTITDIPSATSVEYEFLTDPGAYISDGEIPDPATPAPELEITLNSNDANIAQFQAANTGVRDGDIITVFGVDPAGYNGRWEVTAVALPTISVRCPPYFRTTLAVPGCTLTGLPAYVSGGLTQSTGSLRPVVYESRGTDNNDTAFLSDYTHSFTNTDEDEDGWMDGPCETCHTQTSNHMNDDFGNTHNNGKTCTAACHTHSVGFDKASEFCPAGRVCPPVN